MRREVIRVNVDGQEAFAFTPPCVPCVQLKLNCIASATSNVFPHRYCIKAMVPCFTSVGQVHLAYRSKPLVTSAQHQSALMTLARTPIALRIPHYIPDVGPTNHTFVLRIFTSETLALQSKARKSGQE